MVRAQAVLEIVVFELGRQRYGLMIDDVERVLRAVALTPLPNAPAIIEGLISVAGSPVAVLDIRKRFGLRPKPIDVDDVLIMTRAGDRQVAIRANRVIGVVKVDPADVRDAKTIAPMDPQIAGVATLPDGVVLLHDPRAFLTQAEAVDLARLTTTESVAP
jgi:purine-binding chemotaxis protein CheW